MLKMTEGISHKDAKIMDEEGRSIAVQCGHTVTPQPCFDPLQVHSFGSLRLCARFFLVLLVSLKGAPGAMARGWRLRPSVSHINRLVPPLWPQTPKDLRRDPTSSLCSSTMTGFHQTMSERLVAATQDNANQVRSQHPSPCLFRVTGAPGY
jgi:hypothetical protein